MGREEQNGQKIELRQRAPKSGGFFMHREIDPITLFEYIGILRAGYDGTRRDQLSERDDLPTQANIKKQIGKNWDFMSAADIATA
jgi:hypothetical protein